MDLSLLTIPDATVVPFCEWHPSESTEAVLGKPVRCADTHVACDQCIFHHVYSLV
jgi:hypothetical protein